MPQIPIDEANKSKSLFDFPKLFLEHGDHARIVCLEEPIAEYTHSLKMPQVINGRVVMETIKTRDGGTQEKPATDFVGRFLCLGQFSVLEEKRVAPDVCPMCAASQDSDAIWSPERRFIMHVFQYGTRKGSTDLLDPFSGKTVVWQFNNKRFDKLAEIKTEAASSGGLKGHDLLIGPCTSKQFQNYDFRPSIGPAECLASDERKRFTVATFKGNRAEDLGRLLGERITSERAKAEVAKVVAKHREAFGGPQDIPTLEDISSIDVRDLSPAPASNGDTKGVDFLDVDFLGETKPDTEEKATEPAPQQASFEDLSSLLEGL